MRNMTISLRGACVAGMLIAASLSARAAEPKILYEDKFAKLDAGWQAPTNFVSATDGKLTIHPPTSGSQVLQHQGFIVDDATISAQVRSVANQDQANGVGIAFWAENYGSYYAFLITPNGQYAVYRLTKNRWLQPVSFRTSGLIKKGLKEDNQLQVTVKGNTATLFINGKEVNSITGQPPEGGGFTGLYACSGPKERSVVEFKDFKVTAVK
jgi:hypothetical protein